MSQRETIMQAIESALAGMSATVMRNADAPEQVPVTGLVIVRDGVPEIADETLGDVRTWYIRLGVPIELYVTGPDAATRATRFDALASAVQTALITDATLAALISHVEPTLSEIESSADEGLQSFHTAVLTAAIEYDATSAIG